MLSKWTHNHIYTSIEQQHSLHGTPLLLTEFCRSSWAPAAISLTATSEWWPPSFATTIRRSGSLAYISAEFPHCRQQQTWLASEVLQLSGSSVVPCYSWATHTCASAIWVKVWVCICVCMSVCVCVCILVQMYAGTHTYMYIHMYIYMCIYKCIHINSHE